MNQIDLNGDFLGYKKKTLIYATVIFLIIGASFYMGAKYEKLKLAKLGLLAKNQPIKEKKQKNSQSKNAIEDKPQPTAETVTGKIITKNPNGSITIIKADGSKQDVIWNQQTKLGAGGGGNIWQIYVGQQIEIDGIRNDEGKFSASQLKIVPLKK